MAHVLTLIAGPGQLEEALTDEIRQVLPGASMPDWLSPGEACDLFFVPDSLPAVMQSREKVAKAIGQLAVDFVCQQTDLRCKKLLVADMDSTLIGQECIDELADFAGLKPRIAAITERAMRGELEFELALRERVGLLKGLDESLLQRVFDERITLTPGARVLAQTMRANGAVTIIVSGGFTFFTERVARAAGFDKHQANVLEAAGGKLTGTVREPILGQQAKLKALRSARATLQLDQRETLAVGDGANDLAMISEAGLGIAYHAKPIVAQRAQACINYTDLTGLLFAQGYRREDFAGGESAP